jgi:DNA adenine methylase
MEFDNLQRLHELLNEVNVTFLTGDFTIVEEEMSKTGWNAGDFAYLDPPYHVLANRKVDDQTYSKEGFTDEDERRMRAFCDRIVEAGGHFLMSNHECPEILEYFSGYPYEKVVCYKCFTGKASSRIETKEILLGNVLKSFHLGCEPDLVGQQESL